MRKPVVLSIEDTAFYQKMLRDAISDVLSIQFAGSCEEGILKVLKLLPDIIFLDVMLPDGKGPSLIPIIRTFLPNSFIIMVTSDSSIETVSKAKESGANGYVLKPFSITQIKKYINKWLELFGSSPRPESTPAIEKRIAELDVEKKVVQKNLDPPISPYELWMKQPLASVYPVVFWDSIEVELESKGTVSVLLAWAIRFDGSLVALGAWHEPKKEKNISKFLIKTALKDIKNRGLNTIFFIESSSQIAEDDLSFETARYIPFVLPYLLEIFSHEKILRFFSEKDFESALKVLEMNNIPIDIKDQISALLDKIKMFFLFPVELRRLLLNISWLDLLKEQFYNVLELRGTFSSVESMQVFIFTWLCEDLKLQNFQKEASLSFLPRKNFAQAMIFLSQLFSDSFPSDERYEL
jgi:DNA-binding response OmpR family regulator